MSFEDCIDVVQEWADGRFLQPPIFVDRGDPAAVDFAVGDLTKDGAWHDLDLSGIIPAGASGVLLRVLISANALHKIVFIRKKGNANDENSFLAITGAAGVLLANDGVVPLPASRILEYNITVAVWVTLNFTVAGWWL